MITLLEKQLVAAYLQDQTLYSYALDGLTLSTTTPERAQFISIEPLNIQTLASSEYVTEDRFKALLDKFSLNQLDLNPISCDVEIKY